MNRKVLLAVFGLTCLAGFSFWKPWRAQAQPASRVQWIWFNEGNPVEEAPAGTRYFRGTFEVRSANQQKPVDEATLDITADQSFTVWLNGVEIGMGKNWKRVVNFNVMPHVLPGKNVLAVEAKSSGGPAGLLVRLSHVPNGQDRRAFVSDGSWKASKEAPEGWKKLDFNDRAWSEVKVLGPYGITGRWKGMTWAGGGDDRFTVPPGFRVELAVKNPGDRGPFSLVNMTFDAKGRLLVSQENGPVLLCTDPDGKGVMQKVRPYCELVKNCQGMCWVKDALLLVGNGPDGVGLYRCRDTKGADKIDEAKVLHKFPIVQVPGYGTHGRMGEHGPHAILHGPDGWLYLVVGNHAWAKPDKLGDNSPLRRWPNGQLGPDQDKPHTTEDVLLPRLNDARGHASNILAPGGTIWRMDLEGKNVSLVNAGFRNAFDAAFAPNGELFTFDSDMEWDEALPWYRPVRVCHCPPGADYVWRTGAANTPNYYVDSLPPLYETGRGSPVGLEFYDHHVFPEKYRGAYFMGDWSIGVIWAVHLQRDGATYKAKEVEKFCQGAPMNVTDIGVGPDGALYFTMGGRGSQGGVYRIAYGSAKPGEVTAGTQPLSAWGRAATQRWVDHFGKDKVAKDITALATDESFVLRDRIDALNILQSYGIKPDAKLLTSLLKDKYVEARAYAVYLLGINGYKESRDALINALKDEDAFVRRRACEALIRAGIETPVDAIWPLLADKDQFLRTAARLVLQRIDPKKWTDHLWREESDRIGYEGIIALCKEDKAGPFAERIFERLHRGAPRDDAEMLLAYLRTIQMALIHTSERPGSVRGIALDCDELFPHKDWRVNRELAIVLTEFIRKGVLETSYHGKLVKALLAAKDDRQQQIHFFYCLRLIPNGWSAEEKRDLAAWYDTTKTWAGGHSFTPFLENIFRETLAGFDAVDRKALLANGDKMPLVSLVLAQRLQNDKQTELLPALGELARRLETATVTYRRDELRRAVDDAIIKTAVQNPKAETYPFLLQGLSSPNKLVVYDAIEALKKVPTKPKADDPAPFRAVLLGSHRLDASNRWKAVELLRTWTGGKQFGADEGEWKKELGSWSKWFAQTFPKEPALPDVVGDKPPASKYKYEELLTFLEKDGKTGDPIKGKAVFEKAQCAKCHKYGKLGEGVGPDLTDVSKRFKRPDVLESIYYPSKVISDQYRSTQFVTKKGQQIVGLAAVQGDAISVLQSDGTKVALKKDEIESQFASLVSVMPEQLLDALDKREIADLFAYLESPAEK
jgi:putative heme-binding domain-containing protein